jgi:hypothetical protein
MTKVLTDQFFTFALNRNSMKKKILATSLLFCLTLLVSETEAQYYYRDIVITQQSNQQFQLLKKNKVSKVKMKSYEASGEPTEKFFMEQTLNSGFTQSRTITRNDGLPENHVVNNYTFQGQLSRNVDSSKESSSVYEFQYDTKGKITTIANYSKGYDEKNRTTELHHWKYDENDKLVSMWRIRGVQDSMEVKIEKDSSGKVIGEKTFYKEKLQNEIYYYYNDLGLLSDVVRFNERSGKLLPDFMFEYDPEGRIIQMISTQQGGSNYIIWKYEYNERGLKSKETLYNKDKRRMGWIEYQYEYRK